MISSHLFEAYLECPTKCWLRAQNERSTGNVYADWARSQNESYRKKWLERRPAIVAEADRILSPAIEADRKDATWRLAVDMLVQAADLECRISAVERVRSEGRGRRVQFIPYRFEFSNKLTKQHKLMVAFDAVALSEATGRDIRLGKIIHGDRSATLNVRTSSLISEVRMRIKSCAALAANTLPPDLVLNRHCGQCEFQGRCHKQATEKDDLSLLGGMSDKERKKLHDKGIFTVNSIVLHVPSTPATAAARKTAKRDIIIRYERSRFAKTRFTPSTSRTTNSMARRSIWMSKVFRTAISTT